MMYALAYEATKNMADESVAWVAVVSTPMWGKTKNTKDQPMRMPTTLFASIS